MYKNMHPLITRLNSNPINSILYTIIELCCFSPIIFPLSSRLGENFIFFNAFPSIIVIYFWINSLKWS